MKFLFRLLATWFVGIALVLIVIDGTRMLAANAFLFTSLAETWAAIHASSLAGLQHAVETGLHPAIWQSLLKPLLDLPGWLIFGLPGLVFAFAGSKRSPRRFRRFEQF